MTHLSENQLSWSYDSFRVTGSNADSLWNLDRKLLDHNPLQAIARVNRTKEGKSRGFIVDYYGLSDYLTEALDVFSGSDTVTTISFIDQIQNL